MCAKLAAKGDDVHVWVPRSDATYIHAPGVTVHELEDHFGPISLARIERTLKRERGSFQVLIQYVPHMYGYKGMNIGLAWRIKRWRIFKPWVMFHEVAFPNEPGQSPKHRVLSYVQHMMARWVAKSAARCFISIPKWQPYLEGILSEPIACEWLPVPSNVETTVDPIRRDAIRRKIAPDLQQRVVAHFGTYSSWMKHELTRVIAAMMCRETAWIVVLLGRGSVEFSHTLFALHPEWKERIHATGGLSAEDVSTYLAAADVLYQPYPDGVSSRRGSTMAGLALGLPIVTNSGSLTEPIWHDSLCVRLVNLSDTQDVLSVLRQYTEDGLERRALMVRAKECYEAYFGWPNVLQKMSHVLS